MNKARFEAFSDGVFGFAITLLVLGLVIPEFKNGVPSEADLSRALLNLWSSLLAYVLSFAVIGIMWHNHQALFRCVRQVDRITVLLNLGLLGVTAFIPFATSTLGSYPTLRPSTFLYGATLTCSAILFNLLVFHLRRTRSFLPNYTDQMIHETTVAYRTGLIVYFVATMTALLLPLLSFALYLLVAGYFLFPRGVDTDLQQPPAA
jgi:uncharacterized membrane protein